MADVRPPGFHTAGCPDVSGGRSSTLGFGIAPQQVVVGLVDQLERARRAFLPCQQLARLGQVVQQLADGRFAHQALHPADDRQALAACIMTSRDLLSAADMARIDMPALIGVGTKGDIAGAPQPLADQMHADWVRFIKTGDAGWPQFSEAKKVRLYDETIGLEPVPREAALDALLG